MKSKLPVNNRYNGAPVHSRHAPMPQHLLECAKKAVEMAIEKDEETAIQWLESQKNSIERGN